MTEKQITAAVGNFRAAGQPRLSRLQDYYLGKHDILKPRADLSRPDNRLVSNFCRSITDCTVGYFLGCPVTYTVPDERFSQRFRVINAKCDEPFVNSSIARDLSVYGIAAELVWLDRDGDIRFTKLDAQTVFPVFGDTLDGELVGAVRVFDKNDPDMPGLSVEYYDSERVTCYTLSGDRLTKTGERAHYFGMVPVNFYFNNSDRSGDFEPVMSLIDAYNKLQSESVNDFELFADSYLAISGMGATTTEDIEALRRDRVLLLDDGGQASWLTKTVNDSYIEHLKGRIASDIYRFSNTVDMAEEALRGSNLSGTAIKYRLLNFNNRISVTEKFFTKGLYRRWELICSLLRVLGECYDWRTIHMHFTRNLPAATEDAAALAVSLSGIVSHKTQLDLLPFISDASEELERISAENGAKDAVQ